MKTVGICFGATTVQCVILQNGLNIKSVLLETRIPHEGDPGKILLDFLSSLDVTEIDGFAVTGRNFRKNVLMSSISETESVEYALKEEYPDKNFADLIISSGGETQLVYKIGKNGNITSVYSGSKCASGTGEFFLQQISRMGLTIEEAIKLASNGNPHKVAGRCSVFCKSDCTHALNKGEPKKNVISGLCQMMADKIFELIKDIKPSKTLFIGGATLNHTLVDILRERLQKVDIPKHATTFEALGAALWACDNQCIALPENFKDIIIKPPCSFSFHEPLAKANPLVTFKEHSRIDVSDGECCILGLDVGSTTTKAVLMHYDKEQIIASAYVRTNGNPINASKQCYASIRSQLNNVNVEIIGFGVTGSGRQIAALHALSGCIINEIIAHAIAAVHFDAEVDTIFEIGGQDAKYTYLIGGVPSDYAMNEACSAGTGSFLEESAKESLNVKTEMISSFALQGDMPPNFTDQCAAFISSDIKQASQEGISKNNILAGLVYSICLNYLNRVKKSRPIGKKIFMQGGVCYNKSVPIAMASLIKTQIVVPPDPGLMGALGVSLEIKRQLGINLIQKQSIKLDELIMRKAETVGSFICGGGKEKCDRKCKITKIDINNTIYPFGGACDKYYNLRLAKKSDPGKFNYVAIRQNLLFKKYLFPKTSHLCETAKTVGLMRSFLTHSLGVLYATFFRELGFKIILSDKIDSEGISRTEAAFCLPAEISHGYFLNLIKQKPDYIFLPHVLEIPVANTQSYSKTCVFVQGEPYYLRTTFRKEIEQSAVEILSPLLKMTTGYNQAQKDFVSLGVKMGMTKNQAKQAFLKACEKQHQFEQELLDYGKKALAYLDAHQEIFAIVLLGRPYNAFSDEANMGISHKVASRSTMIIPFDMLPISAYPADNKIYWAMGKRIMQAATMIKERENLFGFYITNFSCGPDSFLLGYFRDCMELKPSLVLELDQHTADAGIDTRIEAALEIMKTYRAKPICLDAKSKTKFVPAQVKHEKHPYIISSTGNRYSLEDPNVEIIFPSMGKFSTEALAAVFKGCGIKTRVLPIPNKETLLEGRKNTLCKECLPYIITTGSFMTYLKGRRDENQMALLFMPTGGGPCRLGQYSKALKQIIVKKKLNNVAVFSLTDENGYAGLGRRFFLRGWQGMVIADIFNDIRSMLAVTAKNSQEALEKLDQIWSEEVLRFLEGNHFLNMSAMLKKVSAQLSQIPLEKVPKTIPVISLIGEIFVRQEEFSRKGVVDYLQGKGFMVKTAPIGEYLSYANYLIHHKLGDQTISLKETIKTKITSRVQRWWESQIKSILAESGLYQFEMIEIDKTIQAAQHLINPKLQGESILTVGLALREILHHSCGVISIGPFGCMPSRVAESILRKEMNIVGKQRAFGRQQKIAEFEDIDIFPCLFIETDGNPYPQMIEANLETFILQARRVHEQITASL